MNKEEPELQNDCSGLEAAAWLKLLDDRFADEAAIRLSSGSEAEPRLRELEVPHLIHEVIVRIESCLDSIAHHMFHGSCVKRIDGAVNGNTSQCLPYQSCEMLRVDVSQQNPIVTDYTSH